MSDLLGNIGTTITGSVALTAESQLSRNFVAVASGVANEVVINVADAGLNIKVGIYDAIDNRLVVSDMHVTTVGENVIALNALNLVSATTYGLVLYTESALTVNKGSASQDWRRDSPVAVIANDPMTIDFGLVSDVTVGLGELAFYIRDSGKTNIILNFTQIGGTNQFSAANNITSLFIGTPIVSAQDTAGNASGVQIEMSGDWDSFPSSSGTDDTADFFFGYPKAYYERSVRGVAAGVGTITVKGMAGKTGVLKAHGYIGVISGEDVERVKMTHNSIDSEFYLTGLRSTVTQPPVELTLVPDENGDVVIDFTNSGGFAFRLGGLEIVFEDNLTSRVEFPTTATNGDSITLVGYDMSTTDTPKLRATKDAVVVEIDQTVTGVPTDIAIDIDVDVGLQQKIDGILGGVAGVPISGEYTLEWVHKDSLDNEITLPVTISPPANFEALSVDPLNAGGLNSVFEGIHEHLADSSQLVAPSALPTIAGTDLTYLLVGGDASGFMDGNTTTLDATADYYIHSTVDNMWRKRPVTIVSE